MLNLPWVSRRAYEVVLDERDGLRASVRDLTDALIRLARVEHGLTEHSPGSKRARPAELEIPEKIRNLLSGFSSGMIQEQMEHEVRQALRKGANADQLADWLCDQLGVAVEA